MLSLPGMFFLDSSQGQLLTFQYVVCTLSTTFSERTLLIFLSKQSSQIILSYNWVFSQSHQNMLSLFIHIFPCLSCESFPNARSKTQSLTYFYWTRFPNTQQNDWHVLVCNEYLLFLSTESLWLALLATWKALTLLVLLEFLLCFT